MTESQSADRDNGPSARPKSAGVRREYRIDPPHREGTLPPPVRRSSAGLAETRALVGEPQLWSPAENAATQHPSAEAPCLITLSLGQWDVPADVVASWQPGSAWDCLRPGIDFVDILANGQRIARGVPMVWQNRICVRITERFPDNPCQPTSDSLGSFSERSPKL